MDLFEPISKEQLDLALQLKGLVQDVVQVRREDDRDHLAGPPCLRATQQAYSTALLNVLDVFRSVRHWRVPLQHAIGGTYRTLHAALEPSAAAIALCSARKLQAAATFAAEQALGTAACRLACPHSTAPTLLPCYLLLFTLLCSHRSTQSCGCFAMTGRMCAICVPGEWMG
jgi:hypothetical protein